MEILCRYKKSELGEGTSVAALKRRHLSCRTPTRVTLGLISYKDPMNQWSSVMSRAVPLWEG